MTEREQERLDIIKQLIGSIKGIGETNYDNKVLNNLDFAEFVIYELINDLLYNAKYERYEDSKLNIQEKSIEIIKNIGFDIIGYIKEQIWMKIFKNINKNIKNVNSVNIISI